MSNPLIHQRLFQEKAVQRYLTALERGDFAAIDAIWQEAASNPVLEQLLFNLHETFPQGQDLLATPWTENVLLPKENAHFAGGQVLEKAAGSTYSSPLNNQSFARSQQAGRRRWPVLVRTLAAILLVTFIVASFLTIYSWNNSRLTSPKPTSTPTVSVVPTPTHPPLVQLPPLCQVTTLPAPYQTHANLNDILALSNNDVWTVGSTTQSQALALHWNGTHWNSTPVPAPGGSSLNSLAAISPSDIWAIGKTEYGSGVVNVSGPPSHTLIEHWNGTRWSQTPSPDLLPATSNILQGITVVAPNDVWAVGVAGADIAKSGYGLNVSPLIEHWNGVRWQIAQLPAIPSSGLNSIVALNAHDIWAAGASSIDDGNGHTPLLVHWDGQSWNQIAAQTINGGAEGRLLQITADASHHLWALGFDSNGLALLLSLNNGQWTAQPVPSLPSGPGASYMQFWNIYTTSPQDIWLAGETVITSQNTFTPLIEHWDGYQWQRVPEQSQGPGNLLAISISTGTVWASGAVDYYGQPLISTTCHV